VGYQLGIDLGTTFTGAAVHRDGRVEICSLGSRTAAIPSVVLLRDDGTVLTGEAAARRALSEPSRVAREFKRRLGDTTPIIVGGSPYSAEALMSRLLRSVVEEVTDREGGPPEAVAVSHPANWGQYKIDLLHQAVLLADLDPDVVTFTTEPAAAATFYAHQERVEPGEVVAVYDLGGGTFDVAVLRAGIDGFEILGRPEGIERLGGVDFDAAVFSHVVRSLGAGFDDLDPDDPGIQNAVARLRQECVDAKEALSSDTDVVIPVVISDLQTEVRLTRAEFEGLIRPSLSDSIASLRRAMRSAGVEADAVSKVLLVGGSSRIPLIAQLVSAELGRPVAIDAHPKHAISMGAAYVAAGHSGVVGAVAAAPPAQAAALPSETPAPVAQVPEPAPPAPTIPEPAVPVPAQPRTRTRTAILAGVGVAALLVIVTAVLVLGGGRDNTGEASRTTGAALDDEDGADAGESDDTRAPVATTAPTSGPARPAAQLVTDVEERIGALAFIPPQAAVEVSADRFGAVTLDGFVDDDEIRRDIVDAARAAGGVTDVSDRLNVRPLDERCTAAIRAGQRWACLIEASLDENGTVRATYVSDFAGDLPNVNGGFHYHLFGSQIEIDQGGVPGLGPWLVWDEEVLETSTDLVFGTGPVPPKLCVRIAEADHSIDGASGNCRPIDPFTG
jgi:molecular chaperone DnaK